MNQERPSLDGKASTTIILHLLVSAGKIPSSMAARISWQAGNPLCCTLLQEKPLDQRLVTTPHNLTSTSQERRTMGALNGLSSSGLTRSHTRDLETGPTVPSRIFEDWNPQFRWMLHTEAIPQINPMQLKAKSITTCTLHLGMNSTHGPAASCKVDCAFFCHQNDQHLGNSMQCRGYPSPCS